MSNQGYSPPNADEPDEDVAEALLRLSRPSPASDSAVTFNAPSTAPGHEETPHAEVVDSTEAIKRSARPEGPARDQQEPSDDSTSYPDPSYGNYSYGSISPFASASRSADSYDSAPYDGVPDGSVPDGSIQTATIPYGSPPHGNTPQGNIPHSSVPQRKSHGHNTNSKALTARSTAPKPANRSEIPHQNRVLSLGNPRITKARPNTRKSAPSYPKAQVASSVASLECRRCFGLNKRCERTFHHQGEDWEIPCSGCARARAACLPQSPGPSDDDSGDDDSGDDDSGDDDSGDDDSGNDDPGDDDSGEYDPDIRSQPDVLKCRDCFLLNRYCNRYKSDRPNRNSCSECVKWKAVCLP